jgi:hypothetical protein
MRALEYTEDIKLRPNRMFLPVVPGNEYCCSSLSQSVSGPNLSASNAAAGRSKIGYHSALGSSYSASLLSDTHG